MEFDSHAWPAQAEGGWQQGQYGEEHRHWHAELKGVEDLPQLHRCGLRLSPMVCRNGCCSRFIGPPKYQYSAYVIHTTSHEIHISRIKLSNHQVFTAHARFTPATGQHSSCPRHCRVLPSTNLGVNPEPISALKSHRVACRRPGPAT